MTIFIAENEYRHQEFNKNTNKNGTLKYKKRTDLLVTTASNLCESLPQSFLYD